MARSSGGGGSGAEPLTSRDREPALPSAVTVLLRRGGCGGMTTQGGEKQSYDTR